MEVEFVLKETHIAAVVTGQWTTDRAKDGIEFIAEEARKHKVTRILIDLFKLTPPKGEMTRFYTGVHMAELWRYPLRVALIAPAEKYNRFAENVAVNRGANIKVFTDEQEAMNWLLK